MTPQTETSPALHAGIARAPSWLRFAPFPRQVQGISRARGFARRICCSVRRATAVRPLDPNRIHTSDCTEPVVSCAALCVRQTDQPRDDERCNKSGARSPLAREFLHLTGERSEAQPRRRASNAHGAPEKFQFEGHGGIMRDTKNAGPPSFCPARHSRTSAARLIQINKFGLLEAESKNPGLVGDLFG